MQTRMRSLALLAASKLGAHNLGPWKRAQQNPLAWACIGGQRKLNLLVWSSTYHNVTDWIFFIYHFRQVKKSGWSYCWPNFVTNYSSRVDAWLIPIKKEVRSFIFRFPFSAFFFQQVDAGAYFFLHEVFIFRAHFELRMSLGLCNIEVKDTFSNAVFLSTMGNISWLMDPAECRPRV